MSLGCFVPARLGSKRLPQKNILRLGDRPMIAHTVETAGATGLFDRIFVCTESEEIRAIAEAHGGTVTELVPPELCGDLVPSWKPCMFVADQLNAAGAGIDGMVCLQPTSPLRSKEDIVRAVEVFSEHGPDFVVSGTAIDPHYFHWALEERENSRWRMTFGEQYLVERPLLPKRLRPNGSVKIGRLAALRDQGHFFGPDLMCVETPEERSVHVGSALDFRFCEFLIREAAGA